MKVAFLTTVPGWWYDSILIPKKSPLREVVPASKFDKKKKNHLRIDYTVGYMLKIAAQKMAQVELISPKQFLKMTPSDVKQYDLIINQFLSTLAVFQNYGTEAEKKYRKLLKSNEKAVYPNMKYTDFIEDKCLYGSKLKSLKYAVADFFCITREEYISSDEKTVDKIMRLIETKGWETVFGKPILGTGSWGTKILQPKQKAVMKRYLKTLFMKKKYPKVMFQENFPEFGTKFYEIRMVFVGDKYQYTVLNNIRGIWKKPLQEGGTIDIPQLKSLIRRSKDIIKKVIKPMGEGLPPLETRIDYGCCVGHKDHKYFVNELEFAGGLMTFMDKNTQFNVHIALTKQLMKVLKIVRKNTYPTLKSIWPDVMSKLSDAQKATYKYK